MNDIKCKIILSYKIIFLKLIYLFEFDEPSVRKRKGEGGFVTENKLIPKFFCHIKGSRPPAVCTDF